MDISEKRQALYAALLRHLPETGSLRERILDRLVEMGLLGSSETQPFRIGQIRNNISMGSSSLTIRTEVIQESLNRLIEKGKILHKQLRLRHAYFLSQESNDDFRISTESTNVQFHSILERTLKNIERTCLISDAKIIVRAFINECFMNFGQHIAKVVTGGMQHNDLLDIIDVRHTLNEVIKKLKIRLDDGAIESLESRCKSFLKSTHPDDIDLKFSLTQGHYVSQLLGIDSKNFNPIAESAFSDAIFYIDTNVLIPGLIKGESAQYFNEAVRISKKLGIKLCVTQATLDEIRTVVLSRLKDLEIVTEKLASEMIINSTRDSILLEYMDAWEKDNNLTPKIFFQRFEDINAKLDELGIIYIPETVDKIIGNQNISHLQDIINRSALETRGWGKSEIVQRHDACHYLLVKEDRKNSKKSWFLTSDNTLLETCRRLNGGDPFIFSLLNFLQAISPFVEKAEDNQPLATFFTHLFESGLTRAESKHLFDLSELRIISELHEDVLSTPSEQLLLALDYVKTTVLHGRQYTEKEHTLVALELKKFLTSSTDEQKKALKEELDRKAARADQEQRLRELAEKENQQIKSDNQKLKEQVQVERDINSSKTTKEWALSSVIGLIGAVICFVGLANNELFVQLIQKNLRISQSAIEIWVRWITLAFLMLCALPMIFMFKGKKRYICFSVVGLIVLANSQIINDERAQYWSAVVTLAEPFILFSFLFFNFKNDADVESIKED